MLIPWGTDAPLYHRPVVTIALIVLNVLSLLLLPAGAYEDWALVLGDGVHPAQWLTNNFMHSGWFHLVGNLIFLWTFGFVVEGKLGWWAFTLVYLGMGVSESAAMQLLVPSQEEVRMLGSSTIIFGLLAMCLVWAPRNEVLCLLWLGFRPILIDLSILWFALIYLLFELLTAGMHGMILATATDDSSVLIVALVPLIEELFWRSFLIRWLIDPDDFQRVPIGRMTPFAAGGTAVLFALAHPEWLPALITGLLWAWLLWQTKSLSACLISHAVANLALGIYVMATGDWKYW